MTEDDFNWGALVSRLVHPSKVAIIEAMDWLGVPLSPRELDLMLDEQVGVSNVSYHMKTLAEAGAMEVVRRQAVRGTTQTFYALSIRAPMSRVNTAKA
jgi:hypothetical protein